MMKKGCIFAILVLLSFTYAGGVVNIDSCGNLNSKDTIYNLTKNVTAPSSGSCFSINTYNITLSCNGYKLTGVGTKGTGIWTSWRSDITVKDCILENFYWGILMQGGYRHNISNNTVTNIPGGRMIYAVSYNSIYSNNVIANSSGATAFFMDGSPENYFNNITDNKIYNVANGIAIGFYSSDRGNSLVLKNNTIFNISYYSILFSELRDNKNIVIDGNTIYSSARGIYLYNISGQTNVTGNIIYDIRQDGIHIEKSKDLNISNNTITNASNGINFLSRSDANSSLSQNNIFNSSNYSMQILSASGLLIVNNSARGAGIKISAVNSSNFINNIAAANATVVNMSFSSALNLTGNNASDGKYGFFMIETTTNLFDFNTASNNSDAQYQILSSNITFTGNNKALNIINYDINVSGNGNVSSFYGNYSNLSTSYGDISFGHLSNVSLRVTDNNVSVSCAYSGCENALLSRMVINIANNSGGFSASIGAYYNSTYSPSKIALATMENNSWRYASKGNTSDGFVFFSQLTSGVYNVLSFSNRVVSQGNECRTDGIKYNSVQEAVTNSEKGDTLIICSNETFYANAIVNKSINIFGSNRGTKVYAQDKNSHLFTVEADYVNISNLSISNASGAAGISSNASNLRIFDSDFSSNFYGVYLTNSSNTSIFNNIASNNSYGFRFDYSDYNNISYNNASGNSLDGFLLYLSSDNNSLSNNSASANSQNGFFILQSSGNTISLSSAYQNNHSGFSLSNGTYNKLNSNNAHGNSLYGISIGSSLGTVIENNSAFNNSNSGIGVSSASSDTIANNSIYANTESGLFLDNSSDNQIFSNNISDNKAHGIYTFNKSSYNNFTANLIAGNQLAGFKLSEYSNDNAINANNISSNYNGFYFEETTGNNLSDNIITNSTGSQIYAVNANATASGNNSILTTQENVFDIEFINGTIAFVSNSYNKITTTKGSYSFLNASNVSIAARNISDVPVTESGCDGAGVTTCNLMSINNNVIYLNANGDSSIDIIIEYNTSKSFNDIKIGRYGNGGWQPVGVNSIENGRLVLNNLKGTGFFGPVSFSYDSPATPSSDSSRSLRRTETIVSEEEETGTSSSEESESPTTPENIVPENVVEEIPVENNENEAAEEENTTPLELLETREIINSARNNVENAGLSGLAAADAQRILDDATSAFLTGDYETAKRLATQASEIAAGFQAGKNEAKGSTPAGNEGSQQESKSSSYDSMLVIGAIIMVIFFLIAFVAVRKKLKF